MTGSQAPRQKPVRGLALFSHPLRSCAAINKEKDFLPKQKMIRRWQRDFLPGKLITV